MRKDLAVNMNRRLNVSFLKLNRIKQLQRKNFSSETKTTEEKAAEVCEFVFSTTDFVTILILSLRETMFAVILMNIY